MPGTFSQIYIQVVFAVKHREYLIHNQWKNELHKYLAAIINAKNQKAIIVNGMPDHIHAFMGMRPSISISDLVREMKNNSTNFINEREFLKGRRFAWQEGFGAFSYSHSDIGRVYDYIKNQETHHTRKTFREEYIGLLNECGIAYEDRFLFEWMDANDTPKMN